MFAHYALLYLFWINMMAGFIIWLDWRHWRKHHGSDALPEGLLLVLGFIGGAAGIYMTQVLLNHRQHRRKYCIRTRLYMVMHVALLMTTPEAFSGIIS